MKWFGKSLAAAGGCTALVLIVFTIVFQDFMAALILTGVVVVVAWGSM